MAKRDNGSGTIRKLKGANGIRYYAYAPARYVCDGCGGVRCVREPLGSFQRRAEARAALDSYAKHPTSKYNATLSDIYQEWKGPAFADISKQTQDNYTAAWAKICDCDCPSIAEKIMREITTGEIRGVLDYWLQPHDFVDRKTGKVKTVGPLSKSYITKIKALMTQLYGYALANNIVDKNYAALVRVPKIAQAGKARAFSDTEFAVLERQWQAVPGGDAVYALCYLGFRVSEFCQLTPAAFNPKAHTLTGGLKTDAGKNRVVPVHHKILPIVERWYQRGCRTLYADDAGGAYNKDSFRRRVWDPAIRALGLPNDLTPHSARHTCGTRMSAAGARKEDIQAILGHEDYSVTANTYINQDLTALTESIERME